MLIRQIFLLATAAALAGCSVISSYRVDGPDARQPTSDNAGSYFLARHVLKVTVTNGVFSVSTEAVADRSAEFQVGFNLSPLADDDVKIEYNKDGLLKSVTSINDDKTADTLQQVATGLAGYRATMLNPNVKISEFTFDPFNAAEARNANILLARAVGQGTCVSVEIFDNVWSPGCKNNPFQLTVTPGYNQPTETNLKRILGPVAPGIYYRRPLNHRVFVSQRGKTIETKLLKFANYAPVMRLDVSRTMFVKRQTTITFDDNGALTSVQVHKPSEALAVATLPATLLSAYIDAITRGFTSEKGVQEARANLFNQQAATLKAERELLAAINQNGDGSAATARATDFRTTNYGMGSIPAGQDADLRRAYTNIAACQAELGATAETCIEYTRRLSTNSLN